MGKYILENLHLFFLIPLVIVAFLSVAYRLLLLVRHIREQRKIKATLRATRRAEKERVKKIKRLARLKNKGEQFSAKTKQWLEISPRRDWFNVEGYWFEYGKYEIRISPSDKIPTDQNILAIKIIFEDGRMTIQNCEEKILFTSTNFWEVKKFSECELCWNLFKIPYRP
jgi:hypothetical protein